MVYICQSQSLPTKVYIAKAMVFLVIMHICESCIIMKVEHQKINAFELWCWGRLLRVTWTASRSNQPILKEIKPDIHWKNWCWNWSSNTLVAAAAKSLQLCLTLCDPIDGSPPGSRLWDSPGKNTGVGCHFLFQCMKVKSESEVAQSCLTLSDPTDCSPPGSSSIHGIFQARVLEWVCHCLLQYFGYLMSRANSLEKTLMLRKTEGIRRSRQQRMRWLDSIINSMDMNLSKLWVIFEGQGSLVCCSPWGDKESNVT